MSSRPYPPGEGLDAAIMCALPARRLEPVEEASNSDTQLQRTYGGRRARRRGRAPRGVRGQWRRDDDGSRQHRGARHGVRRRANATSPAGHPSAARVAGTTGDAPETTPPAVSTVVLGGVVGGSSGGVGEDSTDSASEVVRNEDGSCTGWDGRRDGAWTADFAPGATVTILDADDGRRDRIGRDRRGSGRERGHRRRRAVAVLAPIRGLQTRDRRASTRSVSATPVPCPSPPIRPAPVS